MGHKTPFRLLTLGVTASLLPATARAADVDLSALTGQINFESVSTAIMAIAASLAAVYVTLRGAKIVLGVIRGR